MRDAKFHFALHPDAEARRRSGMAMRNHAQERGKIIFALIFLVVALAYAVSVALKGH
jgi:hypothetical protein